MERLHSNGLIQQETGFDGRRTAYEYDLKGQLLKKTEFGDEIPSCRQRLAGAK
ncbi:hypothetical protein [Pseudomonas sp. LT1P18]|uniref:hypothetical protein n=1 Tax=Pseudomonas arabinosi TaxID=3398357 RepID=UPI0039F04D40